MKKPGTRLEVRKTGAYWWLVALYIKGRRAATLATRNGYLWTRKTTATGHAKRWAKHLGNIPVVVKDE